MSVSENIRALARDGLSVAEIARRLGVSYQHAYTVLKAANLLSTEGVLSRRVGSPSERSLVPATKPPLVVSELVAAGFVHSGRWILSEAGDLRNDQNLPRAIGVYAFAKGDTVLYVGVATMGIAKRLYFYGKPGPGQLTNIRLNGIMKGELKGVPCIDIYTACPPDFEWNGLPVHGTAGLELGLIKKYALPWNSRSAG